MESWWLDLVSWHQESNHVIFLDFPCSDLYTRLEKSRSRKKISLARVPEHFNQSKIESEKRKKVRKGESRQVRKKQKCDEQCPTENMYTMRKWRTEDVLVNKL